jgi:hypothetical protein
MDRTRWFLWSTLAILAAVFWRLLSLDQGLTLEEVVAVDTASGSLSEIVPRVAVRDVLPPLYHLVLHGWMSVFGSSDIAVRSLSLLLSAALFPVMLSLAAPGGRFVQFLVLLLTAASTFHLHASVAVRPYPLLLLLGMTWLLLYQRITAPRIPVRWPTWAALISIQIAMLYTHHAALLLVIPVNVHFFTGRPRSGALSRQWVTAQGLVLGVFSLWLPVMATQWTALGQGPVAWDQMDTLWLTLQALGPAPVHPARFVSYMGLAVGAAALLVGLYRQGKRGPQFLPGTTVIRNLDSFSLRTAVVPAFALTIILAGPALAAHILRSFGHGLPLVDQALNSAYFVVFATVCGLLMGLVYNRYLLVRGHGLSPAAAITLLSPAVLVIMLAGDVPLDPFDLLVAVPILALLIASAWVPDGLLARGGVTALVLAVMIPSAIRERNDFLPRPDLKAAARAIQETPVPPGQSMLTLVWPDLDRRTIEHYLGKGTTSGISGLHQLPQGDSMPIRVNIVLTREALASAHHYASALGKHLSNHILYADIRQMRQVRILQFERRPLKENP